eukprot:COSAG02_NODE_71291_length_191_cov_90.065217_1_plen_55_part_01
MSPTATDRRRTAPLSSANPALTIDRLLIDTMLSSADTNMDGKIDFHEFMQWWQLH